MNNFYIAKMFKKMWKIHKSGWPTNKKTSKPSANIKQIVESESGRNRIKEKFQTIERIDLKIKATTIKNCVYSSPCKAKKTKKRNNNRTSICDTKTLADCHIPMTFTLKTRHIICLCNNLKHNNKSNIWTSSFNV